MIPIREILKNIKGSKTETITNEKGTAIKFGDGTMICYGTATMSVSYATIVFPANFIATPNILVSLKASTSTAAIYIVSSNIIGSSSFNVYARKNDGSAVTEDIEINWQAIGRWK